MVGSSQRFATPPPHGCSQTPPSLTQARDTGHEVSRDIAWVTDPASNKHQRYATPPRRCSRSQTTPPPPPVDNIFGNEVWCDFKDATGEDCVGNAIERAEQPTVGLQFWYEEAPESPDMLKVSSLEAWPAIDPESILSLCEALQQSSEKPPMSMYTAVGISGQKLQVKLPEGITSNFLRAILAKKINMQRLTEDPDALKVFPFQVRLYVNKIEVNYSEPAPFEISMVVGPPPIADPMDPWFNLFKISFAGT